MKLLFTGGSSFSGMWFIKQLLQAGHEVTAVFRFPYTHYAGLRKQRIDRLLPHCSSIFNAPFGEETFLKTINTCSWDMLCHHGANVANYKSPDFDPVAALATNTFNIKSVLHALKDRGCQKIMLTGSVFEQNEGAGSKQLPAVSPYGLSKGLTSDTFAFYASSLQMRLGKFVIPNPFGPFEEERFTTYLAKAWLLGNTPSINTPDYVRDNVPVSLLAAAYTRFTSTLEDSPGYAACHPSFFAESQGEFTKRFSLEMLSRLKIPCPYVLKQQTDLSEPLIRINKTPLKASEFGWKESLFWDELASYYINTYQAQ